MWFASSVLDRTESLRYIRVRLASTVSGLLSPNDLLTELVDRASYRGEVYVALKDLLVPPGEPALPALALGPEPDHPVPVVTETAPSVRAEVVLHGSQPSETTVDGIAVDPDGRLLLTMPAGMARAASIPADPTGPSLSPVAEATRWRWRTEASSSCRAGEHRQPRPAPPGQPATQGTA
jgi:hypothetical protein